ncbi:MAG TPA: aldehyde dehydrogenase family protein [Candidatus Eisenbacteria bacterium]|jgi:aldehyde dehydrogenase (NAD+)|nr:aldehyde dehydrogenase family protein [Candidatus Eisenbacteria bacterium]
MKNYRNWIGGEWTDSVSGRTFADVNPADTRDVLGRAARSDRRDVSRAVAAAKAALGPWASTPAPKRAEILFRSAEILRGRKEDLARLITREMGKTLLEARADVQEAVDTAYFYAGEGRRLYGQTTPSELRDKLCLTFRRPVGVCALITPWNFPVAIPSWKAYPALICGNSMVLKPAEDTPLSALFFAEILSEAGLPPGVFNVVTGTGEEAGRPLAEHPDVSLVSFTGSSKTGAGIAASCGRRLKRCALELGGKNALVLLEDADLRLALDAALWSAFATSGQRCTATSRIIVHRRLFARFLKAFTEKARGWKAGPGEDDASAFGPIVNRRQLESIQRHVRRAVRDGARLVTGGRPETAGAKKHGFFYPATILTRVTPEMAIAREEVFGPVTALIQASDDAEAIRLANDCRYGLSSAVFTRSVEKAASAIERLEAGITYVNSSTIGAEAHLPFGGVKDSGNGHREAGTAALDIFSEWKTVYLDASGRLQKAQVD